MHSGIRKLQARIRADGSAGFSLIELLVSMTVFALAITMTYSAVVLVQQRMNEAEQSSSAVGELRMALAQIDRQVRSGNVLYSPANEATYIPSCQIDAVQYKGSCMRIYTQANGAEKCVQWQVLVDSTSTRTPKNTLLRSRSWASNWSTGGSVTDWSVVARGLAPELLTTAGLPFKLEITGGSGASAYNSRLLNVDLLAYDERQKKNISIKSSMSGRNTNYGYDAGVCTPVPAE